MYMGSVLSPTADPPPTYPEYQAVVELARRLTPRFVDPSNLHPEDHVMRRRGDDWCTAVLGRPAYPGVYLTVHDQYVLIAADRLNVDPPLPDRIVEARRRADERKAEEQRRGAAARDRDVAAWRQALDAAATGVAPVLAVHEGGRLRPRNGVAEYNRHAVPHVDVYSGARSVRTHPAGRPLCESPTRANPLEIGEREVSDGVPATCDRCLTWTTKVRPAR